MIKINYRALFDDKIKVIEFDGESLVVEFYKFIQLEYPLLIRPCLFLRWFDSDDYERDDATTYLISAVSDVKMKTTGLIETASYCGGSLSYQVVIGLNFQCLYKEPIRLYLDAKTTYEELSIIYLRIWGKQHAGDLDDRTLLLFTSEDRKTEIKHNERLNFKTSSFLLFWLSDLRSSTIYVQVETT